MISAVVDDSFSDGCGDELIADETYATQQAGGLSGRRVALRVNNLALAGKLYLSNGRAVGRRR